MTFKRITFSNSNSFSLLGPLGCVIKQKRKSLNWIQFIKILCILCLEGSLRTMTLRYGGPKSNPSCSMDSVGCVIK